MAFDTPPGYLQNAGAVHTAEQMRTFMGGLLNGLGAVASTTRTRGAVVPQLGTALVVTQNGTPNMSVNVGSGVAYIEGTEGAQQGMYAFRAGTVTNLTISSAPGAGLNRIDLIVAKVQDTQYSGATDAASLVVVTGTAASSPSAPAAPNNSLVLAQVFVGALVTSIVTGNITDKRFFMAAAGANTPCTTLTRPTVLYDGLGIFEYDSNLYSWTDGANWFPQSQWVQGQNLWVLPTTVNNFTSTSYVNFTLNAVAQTISFTKRYASTRLRIQYMGSGFASAQPTTITIGANINSTDFDVCKYNYNSANSHLSLGSVRFISGIAAGAVTITARVKVSANTWTTDNNDTFTFIAEEVQ
jgi:hypothetical protein